ncbi:MAG TPA: Uma2 family endonuclease [Gemmataceae bacterium]|nr:Uma2 family endonuclease [Gemmataceae bacterium]
MATATARKSGRRPKENGKVPELIVLNGQIRLPSQFPDLASFRRWCMSPEYPERGDVFWLDGTIWVSDEMEDLTTHSLVKAEVYLELARLVKDAQLGYVLPDGMRLVHEGASLSVEPDVMFVSFESVRSGRVQLLPNEKNRILEVNGSADMVLEVASDSSEDKDDELAVLYFAAGVTEYWRVDARGGELRFDILRRGPKGFVATPRRNGRLKSSVFGRSFRLRTGTDALGNPTYALHVSE